MRNTTKVHQKCFNPNCLFEGNPPDAKRCLLCRTSLNSSTQQQQAKLNFLKTYKESLQFWFKNLKSAKARMPMVLAALVIVATGVWVARFSFNKSQPNLSESSSIETNIVSYRQLKDVVNVPSGTFSYGGSICFAALQREGMNEAIERIYPRFKLSYREPLGNPGCATGIGMLIDKELSFAQHAKPLTEEEYQRARLAGFNLEATPIALDGIVFYTHKSLDIKSLSLKQLRDIFSGKIDNWQQVGGENMPITTVSLDPKVDEVLPLLKEKTGDFTLDAETKIVRDYTSAIREVAGDPGAISYASSAILKGQQSIQPLSLLRDENTIPVAALLNDGSVNLQAFHRQNYPLTRQLFVIIRKDGTIHEKAGIAYINFLASQEGQKILEKAGFYPMYLAE